jgi:hypothetical protein
MGLRSWTQSAIEHGGTVRWLVAISITLLVEGLVAAACALFGMAVMYAAFSPGVASSLFGSSAFAVAWLSATVGLFLGYTRGTFARQPAGER